MAFHGAGFSLSDIWELRNQKPNTVNSQSCFAFGPAFGFNCFWLLYEI
jgi:hypothetical protein